MQIKRSGRKKNRLKNKTKKKTTKRKSRHRRRRVQYAYYICPCRHYTELLTRQPVSLTRGRWKRRSPYRRVVGRAGWGRPLGTKEIRYNNILLNYSGQVRDPN